MKLLRYSLSAIIIILIIWFLLPLGLGILHIGMIYPVILLAFPLFLLLLPGAAHRLWQGRRKIILLLYSLIILALATTSLLMASAHTDTAPKDCPVLVLGCQVNGTSPGLLLEERCQTALNCSQDNPDCLYIASGGLGYPLSEAEVIYNRLIQGGIQPDQIYLEESSTDTQENMIYTAALLKEKDLGNRVLIITNDFHQLRALLYARDSGLEAYLLPAPTPLLLAPGYWARECLALGEWLWIKIWGNLSVF